MLFKFSTFNAWESFLATDGIVSGFWPSMLRGGFSRLWPLMLGEAFWAMGGFSSFSLSFLIEAF